MLLQASSYNTNCSQFVRTEVSSDHSTIIYLSSYSYTLKGRIEDLYFLDLKNVSDCVYMSCRREGSHFNIGRAGPTVIALPFAGET